MKEEKQEEKYLSGVELLELNNQSEILKGLEKDEIISNLKLQLIDAQKIIITYKMIEDKKKIEEIKTENYQILKSISDVHDIPDDIKWNYEKSTGKIII